MAICITLPERKSSRAGSPLNPHPLNDAEDVEALAFGFGIPAGPIQSELRSIWWRLRAHGVRLPAERRVVLIEAGVP